jgi:hypothetical protein
VKSAIFDAHLFADLGQGLQDQRFVKPRRAAALALAGWYLMLLGAGCLIIVVLTHVCEAFHWFPVMGWGLKHSSGHYLDLSAAILGLTFITAGYFLALIAKVRN